jgi:hypothetical protein
LFGGRKNMKKQLMIVGIIIILLNVGLSGCTENIIQGSGKIQFNDFEGGFYGIVGDDNEYYDPINLPSEFKEDDIRIKYSLRSP